MSSIFQQMPGLQILFYVFIVIIVGLYILSIIWVVRDATNRGMSPLLWGIIALIPLVGPLAYNMLRNPLLISDQEEQDVELALKRRQLMQYGECGSCGYPVEADYIMCPNCHQRLKNLCPTCHHALDPRWSVCPYCTTTISIPHQSANRNASASSRDAVRHRPAQGSAQSSNRASADSTPIR